MRYTVEIFTSGNAAVKQVLDEEPTKGLIQLYTDHVNRKRDDVEEQARVLTFEVPDDGETKQVYLSLDHIVAITATPVEEPEASVEEAGAE